jgi:hypothetical protein
MSIDDRAHGAKDTRLPEALRARLRATHRRSSKAQSNQTHGFKPKGDRNLIASIRALSMISIPSFGPSASKPHDKDAKREQNPRYTRYNGRTTNPAMHRPRPKEGLQGSASDNDRSERAVFAGGTLRAARAFVNPGQESRRRANRSAGLDANQGRVQPASLSAPAVPGTHPYLRDRALVALPYCRGRHASGGEFDSSQSSIQTAQLRCFSALPNPYCEGMGFDRHHCPCRPF